MISKSELKKQADKHRKLRIGMMQETIENRMIHALAEGQKSISIYSIPDFDLFHSLNTGVISTNPYRVKPCLKDGVDGLTIYFDLEGEEDGN